jgi:flagellar biosynthesis/type III secretory pathway chaperone
MTAQQLKAKHLISSGIEQDIATTELMIQLLSDEKKALETRDISEIERLSQIKTELADKMTESANTRSRLLDALELSNDEAGIVSLFDQTEDKSSMDQWLLLKNNLQSCQDQNLVNSKIASRTRNSLKHLLTIVQGKMDKPNIYNPLGSTSAIVSGNLIGEA